MKKVATALVFFFVHFVVALKNSLFDARKRVYYAIGHSVDRRTGTTTVDNRYIDTRSEKDRISLATISIFSSLKQHFKFVNYGSSCNRPCGNLRAGPLTPSYREISSRVVRARFVFISELFELLRKSRQKHALAWYSRLRDESIGLGFRLPLYKSYSIAPGFNASGFVFAKVFPLIPCDFSKRDRVQSNIFRVFSPSAHPLSNHIAFVRRA